MKLTIETLTTLTSQDSIYLAKIWPDQQVAQWIDWLSHDKKLFAARFNDRLLAGVKVSLSSEQGKLHDLLVRTVTRRRGVGLYLVNEIQIQLPTIKRWQFNYQSPHHNYFSNYQYGEMDGFMYACGFIIVDTNNNTKLTRTYKKGQ